MGLTHERNQVVISQDKPYPLMLKKTDANWLKCGVTYYIQRSKRN